MGFRPRSNVRRKQRLAAESDEDDDIDITKHIRKAKATPVQPPPSTRAPTKLSFGDDDDSEFVFRKKKKKKPKARGVSTIDLDGTDAAAAGSSYSAATLADLKEQTPKMPTKFADAAPRAKDGPAVFKMSGSFRAKATTTSHESAMPDSFKVSSMTATKLDIPPPPGGPPQPSSATHPPQPTASSPPPSAQLNGKESTPGDGATDEADLDTEDFDIPSAEMIRLAKEKRQRLRGAHMAPGYIPSENAVFRKASEYKVAEDAVKKGSDDESGDDEGDDLRLKFSGVRVHDKPPKHKPLSDALHEDSDSGEDFADAQVRRALGGATNAPHAARLAAAAGRNAAGGAAYAAAAAVSGGAVSAATRGVAALQGMASHVARMRARRDAALEQARRTRAQVAASAAAAVDAQRDFGDASGRYEFLQSLRSYVRDLCACLEHKIADVEALEEERLSAMKEMCEATRAQREEVMSEVMVAGQAAVDAWRRREDPAAAALRAEAEQLERALPPQLDEFGRDENAARRDRAATRGKARAAAIAPFAQRLASEPAAALCDAALAQAAAGVAGAGVTSCGGADRQAYYARRTRELQDVAATTLSDVAADFASMAAVLQRLRDFKEQHPVQYGRAYVSEALPALVSVYVRLQLLDWDPMYANGEDRQKVAPRVLHFEEHDWFRELLEFSGDAEDDPDTDLVPAVVAQVVARHSFAHTLQQAWDPCVPDAAAAVRSALDSLLTFTTPATQDHLFALVETVSAALARSADDAAVPTWPPCALVQAPVAAAATAAAWEGAVELLKSVTTFQGLLSQKLLAGVVGDRLLHKHLVPAIDACVADAERYLQSKDAGAPRSTPHAVVTALMLALHRILQVSHALPRPWLRAGKDGAEGVAAVASLKVVAQRAVRLVAGRSGGSELRGLQEDAELVREKLSLA
eukprot:jgi/Ulvmu1/8463/UM043_0043.1